MAAQTPRAINDAHRRDCLLLEVQAQNDDGQNAKSDRKKTGCSKQFLN
jgi:hypothetical protein